MNSRYVLDASALLALLNDEQGSKDVAAVLHQGVVMSTVNFSEVVAKLNESGIVEKDIHTILDPLGIQLVDFNLALSYNAGLLRKATKHLGLSFGDRACIALAEKLRFPILTADKAWIELDLSIRVRCIR